jgi:hypothetical protein
MTRDRHRILASFPCPRAAELPRRDGRAGWYHHGDRRTARDVMIGFLRPAGDASSKIVSQPIIRRDGTSAARLCWANDGC